MKDRVNRRSLALAAIGFALTAGLLSFGTVLLAADPDDEGDPDNVQVVDEDKDFEDPALKPEPTQIPRPDERSATSIESASDDLRGDEGLDKVISATLAGDAEALIELGRLGDICEQPYGASVPECEDSKEYPGVYFQAALPEPVLVPAEVLQPDIGAILANGPMELTLVVKDSDGEGKYYLVFRSEKAARLGNSEYDALGLVVKPGEERPIQWFRFLLPANNGLDWLQILTEATGATFDLVAPESIDDWTGLWGDKAD